MFRICIIFLISVSILFADDTNSVNQKLDTHSNTNTEDGDHPVKTPYRYISINPGVTLENVTLSIQGRNRDAMMVQDGVGKVSWLLDVKSPEYQISKYFGVNLLLHTSNFYLNRQSIPKIFSNSPSVRASSDESSGGSDNERSGSKRNRVEEDVYTNVEGRYSMLVPILYIGNPDTFRFGFGFGPAHVKLKGNVDFKDSASNLLLITSGPNRNDFLNNLSAYQFASGNINPNIDPALSYLVANLSTGNNLELTAYYLASQGLLRPDLAAITIFQSGRYNAAEALAISSLMRNQVRVDSIARFAFIFYLESPPIYGIRGRLSFGGPIVKENGYTYELRTFHFAFYKPIEF